MKIALVTYSTKPRGSVIHTLELATALTDLGQQVCIIALDKDGLGFETSPPCAIQLVPAAPVSGDSDQLIQQRITELVSAIAQIAETFDIYHAQDCLAANALIRLRQRGQIALVVRTLHHVEDYQSTYLRQCQENSIRLPDRCFCVSDYWQGFLAREYGVMAPRVINGVNRQRFSAQCSGAEAELKQRYGLTGWPIYLTVGGIEPRKNSLHLIQAFAEVLKLYADAQLVIAGGATLFDYQDYRQQFFVAAETLALPTQSLRLPGVVPAQDLPVLYRCADVFCFPSHREGWGLVVLEAIASKLPIIVSRCHPFTEFLGPDQALWVDPDDPQTIARAMVEGLSPAAKTRVDHSQDILPNYSWSTSAQLHLDHYGQLLAQRSPG